MFGIGNIGKKVEDVKDKAESTFSGMKSKVGTLFKLAKGALMATGAVSIYKSLTKDKAKEYVDKGIVFNAENNGTGTASPTSANKGNEFDDVLSNDGSSGTDFEPGM